jgi:hypothetical protein
LIAAQREIVGLAIGMDFAKAAVPVPFLIAVYGPVALQESHHFVQGQMRIRLTHQDEMQLLVFQRLNEGLATEQIISQDHTISQFSSVFYCL